jgi:hypothetical protein
MTILLLQTASKCEKCNTIGNKSTKTTLEEKPKVSISFWTMEQTPND